MDFSRLRPPARSYENDRPTLVVQQRSFARLLAFAGWTIDDVVSNPIAKRDVRNWFKTDRRLHRQLDVIELERQWNAVR